jgi:hypothetical protein
MILPERSAGKPIESSGKADIANQCTGGLSFKIGISKQGLCGSFWPFSDGFDFP